MRQSPRIEQMLGNQQLKRSEEAISFILCGILEMAGNEAKTNISRIYSGIRAESSRTLAKDSFPIRNRWASAMHLATASTNLFISILL